MFETSIVCDVKNRCMLNYVDCQLKKLCPNEVVCAVAVQDDEATLAVACRKVYERQLCELLKDLVATVLCIGYKNGYFKSRLLKNETAGNFYAETLVNTMCFFDSSADVEYMKKQIDPHKPMYLYGYYNFTMQNVRKKWDELIAITRESSLILHEKSVCCDFLGYLLESMPSKLQSLSVEFCENDFHLFDSRNKLINKYCSLCENSTMDKEAMLNMICLKPRLVKLYTQGYAPCKEFMELSQLLFTTKTLK